MRRTPAPARSDLAGIVIALGGVLAGLLTGLGILFLAIPVAPPATVPARANGHASIRHAARQARREPELRDWDCGWRPGTGMDFGRSSVGYASA